MSEGCYDPCFEEEAVVLGPMAGSSWRWNPMRLGVMLARYKFVARMLKDKGYVAEIGCADGFGSMTVAKAVRSLHLFDFDARWVNHAKRLHGEKVCRWDIVEGPLPFPHIQPGYDGIFMLDVIEHIKPADEPKALAHISSSLARGGVFIAGAPSLESQQYATPISRAGHVNCKSGERFQSDLRHYFGNVFLFGMNDEVLHTGYPPMCHYLFALCTEPRHDIGAAAQGADPRPDGAV